MLRKSGNGRETPRRSLNATNKRSAHVSRSELRIGVAIPPGMSAPYAYFTPAIALGYDRQEGLDFSFFYGGEPGSTARSLCAGACDIACLNTIVGFIGRSQGLPMLAIGSKAR